MKIYTYQEALEELETNLQVQYKPYGTWIITSHFGRMGSKWQTQDHFYEVEYISHSEEDSIGIFDGETYNPQDYNEWLYGVFDPELDENDCIDNYIEEELTEKFEEYCRAVWADSSNDDNYEPIDDRYKRLAKGLLEMLEDSTTTITDEAGNVKYSICGYDDVIFTKFKDVIVFDESDNEFLEEVGYSFLEVIGKGEYNTYYKAKEEWEELKNG